MANTSRTVIPARSIIDGNRQRMSTSSSLRYPDDLHSHAMVFNFKEYSYSGGEIRNGITGSSVILPLPKVLVDATTPDVMSRELGITGSAVADVYGNVGKSVDFGAMGKGAADAVSSLVSGNMQNLTEFALFAVRAGIGSISPEIQGGLAAATGTAVNPHSALVFNGVNMKTYTFDWSFIPKNLDESTRIKDIVRTLKAASLPRYDSVAGGPIDLRGSNTLTRGLLKYPKMVDIFFVGLDPDYFPVIKTAMISQVLVDYTPQGHMTLVKGERGSKPQMVNVTVTVIESEIHTAADYEG